MSGLAMVKALASITEPSWLRQQLSAHSGHQLGFRNTTFPTASIVVRVELFAIHQRREPCCSKAIPICSTTTSWTSGW